MGDEYAKREALQSSESTATVVHAIIHDKYGDEVYDWDPVTVYLEVKADFKADMDPAVTDRWSAIQVIMTTDAFFKRLDAFLGVCNTLTSGAPFFQLFDPVTVEEAAWAITEVSLNRELLPFSYTIQQYLEKILKADGYAKSNYPTALQEVFDIRPEALAIRKDLSGLDNHDKTEAFVDEQLTDMVYQFGKIPSLKSLDDIILRRSMDEYVGTVATKDSQ